MARLSRSWLSAIDKAVYLCEAMSTPSIRLKDELTELAVQWWRLVEGMERSWRWIGGGWSAWLGCMKKMAEVQQGRVVAVID